MSASTVIHVTDIQRIGRGDAEPLATAAYDRLSSVLTQLAPEDWQRPTDCTGWDVAAMTGHIIGAAKSHDSRREFIRQAVWGARHKSQYGGNGLDATNDLQVRDHAELTPEQRLAELARCAAPAVRGRMRFPRLLRRVNVPMDQGGNTAPGTPAKLNLGHLMDVILTRDIWLHRIDIARATGRAIDVDSDLDRRVVADVVGDWADRHAQPFRLELTGPAGGTFVAGSGGERHTLDAVEFARILSGRADGDGLLRQKVIF